MTRSAAWLVLIACGVAEAVRRGRGGEEGLVLPGELTDLEGEILAIFLKAEAPLNADQVIRRMRERHHEPPARAVLVEILADLHQAGTLRAVGRRGFYRLR